MGEKKCSWLSYISLGLGISLILHPFFTNVFPKYFMYLQYIGISITIIFSVMALLKKNEKKPIAAIGLFLAVVMAAFVGVLLYISFNKYSPV
jgi:4-hydroxybenzoate polyprenyltransferase